jgi:hypothetical protein
MISLIKLYSLMMLVTVHLVACLFVWSNYERPANVTLWNITTRDIFCDGMCRNTVPEVIPQNDARQNGVLEPFLPDINTT